MWTDFSRSCNIFEFSKVLSICKQTVTYLITQKGSDPWSKFFN